MLPGAESCDALCAYEPRLAVPQRLGRALRAEHVTGSMGEDLPGDRLRREVRGAGLECLRNRIHVVEPGEHQHGDVEAARKRA